LRKDIFEQDPMAFELAYNDRTNNEYAACDGVYFISFANGLSKSQRRQSMAVVRAHTPASSELSEQFDQTNGAQTSAINLTWSYAASSPFLPAEEVP
jgi:GH15 family glucan-1,4-alpha-glucosidase